jgi:hypothetical protein
LQNTSSNFFYHLLRPQKIPENLDISIKARHNPGLIHFRPDPIQNNVYREIKIPVIPVLVSLSSATTISNIKRRFLYSSIAVLSRIILFQSSTINIFDVGQFYLGELRGTFISALPCCAKGKDISTIKFLPAVSE